MEPYFIGQVVLFGGDFAPRGWAFCDGQLLAVSSHDALFSILGTIYGGDGRTTFALPDLRGRVPIGAGQGAGLTNRPLGQKSGHEKVPLNIAQIPSHNHAAPVITSSNAPDTDSPAGSKIASNQTIYSSDASAPVVALGSTTTGMAGGSGVPHNNMQEFNTLNYIIALNGPYPSRS